MKIFLLVLLLTACAAPVSAMQSPLVAQPPLQIRGRFVIVMNGYAPRSNVSGVECDSFMYPGFDKCPQEPILASPTGWIRFTEIRWADHEVVRGQYDFSGGLVQRYRDAIATAKAHGIKTIMVIRTVPAWASIGVCGPIAPAYYEAFGRFVVAAIASYGMDAVELGNEPDLPSDPDCYTGGWPDGATYAAMTQVAYPIIKAVRPDVTIISGGIAGDPSEPWMQQAVVAGIQADVIAFHAYQWLPETADATHARYIALRAKLPDMPLAMTEGGLGLGSYPVTAANRQIQADYLTRMIADCRADGEIACIWYRANEIDYWHTEMFDGLTPNRIYDALVEAR